ncbi:hypothetical protein K6V78_09780 [Streptococcus gallolyticus]|nr:hypothetical protein [Streptococcus gallolyticus]MBY5041787.1 hypothetical protein [Streptococcus gallolyticus]
MARKKSLQDYKKPLEKIERDLAKVEKDKQALSKKEAELKKEFAQKHADYVMFLIADSGLSPEDLESLLLSDKTGQSGGE